MLAAPIGGASINVVGGRIARRAPERFYMAWMLSLLAFVLLLIFAAGGNKVGTGVSLLAFVSLFGFAFVRALIRWMGRQWRGNH